jgi:hypothetical protein
MILAYPLLDHPNEFLGLGHNLLRAVGPPLTIFGGRHPAVLKTLNLLILGLAQKRRERESADRCTCNAREPGKYSFSNDQR